MIGNKNKTILITGINGFLGSELGKLFYKSYNVIGLEKKTSNLYRLNGLNIKVFKSTKKGINRIFKEFKVNYIIHTATLYGRNKEKQSQIINSNFLFPVNLLDLAIKNNVEVFINTDTVLEKNTNIYSLTKKQFTDWLFFRSSEIKVINMKLEHFYGPGCSETNFITSMINKLKSNIPKIDLTFGEQQRNFVYYSDLTEAYKVVVDRLQSISEDFIELEVSTPEFISIKNLMLILKKKIGSKTELKFGTIPYRSKELMKRNMDNGALIALGWEPKVKILDGINLMLSINKNEND